MANKPRPDIAPRRPSTAELPEAADQWVHGNDAPATASSAAPATAAKPPEATRRLTLDIPASLHFAMKMRATATGVAMVDEVTPLLMAHYADDLKRYQRG
ncbi:hypothetical protein [Mycobacterium riyadhense]|uniref:hypothetical protein n=1 Tax=Mycobacterium riyadhense TaxID=486698 RepID=UPI001EF9F675|nr:hypothetical protein [Mycobacterium riyadhense]